MVIDKGIETVSFHGKKAAPIIKRMTVTIVASELARLIHAGILSGEIKELIPDEIPLSFLNIGSISY